MDAALVTAIGTAISDAAGDIAGLVTSNLPVVLGVTLAFVGLNFAVRMVKRVGRG